MNIQTACVVLSSASAAGAGISTCISIMDNTPTQKIIKHTANGALYGFSFGTVFVAGKILLTALDV